MGAKELSNKVYFFLYIYICNFYLNFDQSACLLYVPQFLFPVLRIVSFTPCALCVEMPLNPIYFMDLCRFNPHTVNRGTLCLLSAYFCFFFVQLNC